MYSTGVQLFILLWSDSRCSALCHVRKSNTNLLYFFVVPWKASACDWFSTPNFCISSSDIGKNHGTMNCYKHECTNSFSSASSWSLCFVLMFFLEKPKTVSIQFIPQICFIVWQNVKFLSRVECNATATSPRLMRQSDYGNSLAPQGTGWMREPKSLPHPTTFVQVATQVKIHLVPASSRIGRASKHVTSEHCSRRLWRI